MSRNSDDRLEDLIGNATDALSIAHNALAAVDPDTFPDAHAAIVEFIEHLDCATTVETESDFFANVSEAKNAASRVGKRVNRESRTWLQEALNILTE